MGVVWVGGVGGQGGAPRGRRKAVDGAASPGARPLTPRSPPPPPTPPRPGRGPRRGRLPLPLVHHWPCPGASFLPGQGTTRRHVLGPGCLQPGGGKGALEGVHVWGGLAFERLGTCTPHLVSLSRAQPPIPPALSCPPPTPPPDAGGRGLPAAVGGGAAPRPPAHDVWGAGRCCRVKRGLVQRRARPLARCAAGATPPAAPSLRVLLRRHGTHAPARPHTRPPTPHTRSRQSRACAPTPTRCATMWRCGSTRARTTWI